MARVLSVVLGTLGVKRGPSGGSGRPEVAEEEGGEDEDEDEEPDAPEEDAEEEAGGSGELPQKRPIVYDACVCVLG